ncbi:MAG: DegT/DnrJ/EryC1/StrS family aminotransferase [Chloroflexi bacterium]|nr:DegT/DnrJ/EryC1/StrS family aminotransferase [Chloroflexota bacterium]
MIDLRSDTVTLPSPAMRHAMAEAEVGDDVWGEDPTVRALEERSAELLGAEAGLLVASGTMGNLVGLLAHVPRGGEIIGPAEIHTFSSEGAGHAVVVGASARAIPAADDGTIDLVAVRGAVRDPSDVHQPISALITIENTHALSMGQPLAPAYMQSLAELARDVRIPLFIDGARLFNAAVALGVPARDLVPARASATFCLSKSLACPVGSVVVGDTAFIARARRARKMVGGGMRQAGIIAAAGLVALRDGPLGMIDRLADDHANARYLADALASMPGVTGLDPTRVRTNFVLFAIGDQGRWPDDRAGRERAVRTRAAFLARLEARGVRMIEYPEGRIRAIPHYGIERADIDTTIAATRAALAEVGLGPAVTSARAQPAVAPQVSRRTATGSGPEPRPGARGRP